MKTSYSRRELYALGEPLGDGATRMEGGRRVYGGGGGVMGSTPASNPGVSPIAQNEQQQGIAAYAQPYVNSLLGATMQNVFDVDQSGNVTGMKGYNPYSMNAADYFAGFSPLQQQTQREAANWQTGPAAFQSEVGGYMNPYLQQSLAPQIAETNRAYDISAANQMGQATRAGAFGGGREALMRSENERNRNAALQNVIGQGYNTAFQNAQNQFNTGFGQRMGVNALQQGLGQQQQQQQQNIINQAVQNYQTAQQYPMQQLGQMKSMLAGLPISTSSQQQYQAAPSMVSQLTGLGVAGLGLGNLMGGGRSASGGSSGGGSGLAGLLNQGSGLIGDAGSWLNKTFNLGFADGGEVDSDQSGIANLGIYNAMNK
jgi:hypothetical protein